MIIPVSGGNFPKPEVLGKVVVSCVAVLVLTSCGMHSTWHRFCVFRPPRSQVSSRSVATEPINGSLAAFSELSGFFGFFFLGKVQNFTASFSSSELSAQMAPSGVIPHWRSPCPLHLHQGPSVTLQESNQKGDDPRTDQLRKEADSELPGWQPKETASQLPHESRASARSTPLLRVAQKPWSGHPRCGRPVDYLLPGTTRARGTETGRRRATKGSSCRTRARKARRVTCRSKCQERQTAEEREHISTSGRNSTRVLHRLGACCMVPGIDYPLQMPKQADFDSICKLCSRKGATLRRRHRRVRALQTVSEP